MRIGKSIFSSLIGTIQSTQNGDQPWSDKVNDLADFCELST